MSKHHVGTPGLGEQSPGRGKLPVGSINVWEVGNGSEFDACGQKVEALVLVGTVAGRGGAVCCVFLISGSLVP